MAKQKRQRNRKIKSDVIRTMHIGPATDTPPPAEIVKIVETVSADDRAWFRQHPDVRHFVRAGVQGEFWPIFHQNLLHVVVVQLTPSYRLRVPVLDGEPEGCKGVH